MSSTKRKRIVLHRKTFNVTFKYIDDVQSNSNPNFTNWIPLISPKNLFLIKETAETVSSASFLDTYLFFYTNGQLFTRFYDKNDDFNFAIINCPHLHGNKLTAPAYGVYISQLIRYVFRRFSTSPYSKY